MISDVKEALIQKEVQEFIVENYKTDLSKVILQGSPFKEIPVQELAVQLSGKKKSEKKLPTWFKTEGILYPPTLNLEQTSSETTAAYKASLVSGKSLIDLTGGFGVDTYFFAESFEEVVHCELNPQLSEIVAHNLEVFKRKNIRIFTGDGIKILKRSPAHFDWIYIDPSRRDEAGGRVFHLSDCLPDVPAHQELLQEKASNILIKTSPLLDLRSGISSLENVREIHIIAVKNEVKELLWIIGNSPFDDIHIKTLNFTKTGPEVYERNLKEQSTVEYGQPLTYLYEPNAAIMKSGLFDAVAQDFKLVKLHPNSHLYTSEELKDFPGRRFDILDSLLFSRKKLRKAFDFQKAHIATRNFPESVASLRKQLKLKDGGEYYLFFTTTGKDEKIVLVCKKAD